MSSIVDHPLRYQLANELHARPFPDVAAPGRAVFLAVKPADGANRDREAEFAHLLDLLGRFGAQPPPSGATHYFGDLGKYRLKWESHTEFQTFTILISGASERVFDPSDFGVFPDEWLAKMPASRISSALIRISHAVDDAEIERNLDEWFVPESLAVSRVNDDAMVIAGDFRIDSAGHMRFAVFPKNGVGADLLGRLVQRLCDIETYKSMSMLGFRRVRDLAPELSDIDLRLSAIMQDVTAVTARSEETLQTLLKISTELESVLARSNFRFGATGAYEKIVQQRIDVLRESRFNGRQSFGEFMARRYDPAMRTVKSTELRLRDMAERASRAADLLRTRVDVERSAQNQELLESMDRRADLQLRLQKTVEGLSVVAISYYAVNLVVYAAAPLAATSGIGQPVLTAVATPLVVLGVWWLVRQIRRAVN